MPQIKIIIISTYCYILQFIGINIILYWLYICSNMDMFNKKYASVLKKKKKITILLGTIKLIFK